MIPLTLFGPVDVLAEEVVGGVLIVEFLLLALTIVNLVTRAAAYRGYATTARDADGDEGLTRSVVHEASNVLLVLGAFYYITVELHAGIVFALFAVGLFITDFFEFEARLVEARKDAELERPKGSLVASALAFAYIAYKSLFFLVEPLWNSIV